MTILLKINKKKIYIYIKMATQFTDQELKQAFTFFAGGRKELALEDYLNALRHVGVVYNKAELAVINEGEKKTFKEADFLADYKKKTSELTKDILLKCFQVFDPDGTGTISYDQLQRALVSYGERLSKEEADLFFKLFTIKEGSQIDYNELLDKMMLI